MIDLETIHLSVGDHERREDGICAMEAAAYFAGEQHTDRPKCVCPVIGEFVRTFNDALLDRKRQRLKRYIPRLIKTGEDGMSSFRKWLATDWLLRVFTPYMLGKAGLKKEQRIVQQLDPLLTFDDLRAADKRLSAIRRVVGRFPVSVAQGNDIHPAWTVSYLAYGQGCDALVVRTSVGTRRRSGNVPGVERPTLGVVDVSLKRSKRDWSIG